MKAVLSKALFLQLILLLFFLPENSFGNGNSEAESRAGWFKQEELPVLVGTLITTLAVLFFIQKAKRRKKPYIRPIPGLEAVEEAVGRATEMGKPVLYCCGVGTIRCPGVLASMTLVGWVAEIVARYGAAMTFPVNDPINLSIGQEAVQSGYYRAGRADAYHDDIVYFISGLHFAFTAAVCGVMERERPAANFFFGSFWSEALVLTETGSNTGALQITATDSVDQIPFMVTTCDYVIIGEELYAASAYLGDSPEILGGLKGQDLIKALILILLVVGLFLGAMRIWFPHPFQEVYTDFLSILGR